MKIAKFIGLNPDVLEVKYQPLQTSRWEEKEWENNVSKMTEKGSNGKIFQITNKLEN